MREKQRLMNEFVEAASECNLLHSMEIQTLMRGEYAKLDEQIARANERRENAKYALLNHLEGHRC